jgi:hypothetical protein
VRTVRQTDDLGSRSDDDIGLYDTHTGVLPVPSVREAHLLRLQRQPRAVRVWRTPVVGAHIPNPMIDTREYERYKSAGLFSTQLKS